MARTIRLAAYAVVLSALVILPANTTQAQYVDNLFYPTIVESPSVTRYPDNSVTQTIHYGDDITVSATIEWKKNRPLSYTPMFVQAYIGDGPGPGPIPPQVPGPGYGFS